MPRQMSRVMTEMLICQRTQIDIWSRSLVLSMSAALTILAGDEHAFKMECKPCCSQLP